jgi:hypothetical protein
MKESVEADMDGVGVFRSISSSPSISFELTQDALRSAEEIDDCESDRNIKPDEAGDANGTEEISSNDSPKLSSASCPPKSTAFFFGLRAPTAAEETVLNFFFG